MGESMEWWPPARVRGGDSETRYMMRLAAAEALHLPPRDPRFWEPRRERGWDNTQPKYGQFIPSFEIKGGDQLTCMGQIEPFIRRPSSKPRSDHVSQRMSLGRRTSPLISYNSVGWNRRHYEPVPDIARVQPRNSPFAGPRSAVNSRNGLNFVDGYASAQEEGDFEPPRIEGIDTASRPPLVIHSSGKMRRPAWIGTRY